MNTRQIVLMLALTFGITHAENAMPPKQIENIIPILSVNDLNASVDHYEKVLGFQKAWAGDGFGSVSRDGFNIYLAEGNQGVPGKAWVWMGVQVSTGNTPRAARKSLCHPPTSTTPTSFASPTWMATY